MKLCRMLELNEHPLHKPCKNKITEQHYAQIHPDYREKAREYAKRTYASIVAVVR